ncbi:MAG: PCYCGC motif-containing (lipo)protein [Blastocatellia bacterium]
MNKTIKTHRHAVTLAVALCFVFLLSACNNSPAPTSDAHKSHDGSVKLEVPSPDAVVATNQNVPHFHETAEEARPFPKTLDPEQFSDPTIKYAYQTARRIPDVLAQQPCYCFCDKGFGHGSLLDCHIDDHSAG